MSGDDPRNPPYSLVCEYEHVLADEIEGEPAIAENGARRCTQSGCLGLAYSHCEVCRSPLPGLIDGGRYGRPVKSGALTIVAPAGRIDGRRKWRTDCPTCKAPYPWARTAALCRYHQQHLKEVANHSLPRTLPFSKRASDAYRNQSRGGVDDETPSTQEVRAALEWILGVRSSGRKSEVLGPLARLPVLQARGARDEDTNRLEHLALEALREQANARGTDEAKLLTGLFSPGRSIKETNRWLANSGVVGSSAVPMRRRYLTTLGANWLLDAERTSIETQSRPTQSALQPKAHDRPWWRRSDVIWPLVLGVAVTVYLGVAPAFGLPPFRSDDTATGDTVIEQTPEPPQTTMDSVNLNQSNDDADAQVLAVVLGDVPLRVRNAATTDSDILGEVAVGSQVTVLCFQRGERVTVDANDPGNDLWHRVRSEDRADLVGFVTDVYLDTLGGDQPLHDEPPCTGGTD